MADGRLYFAYGSNINLDALEALKAIGITYGLYSRDEDQRGCRVVMEGGEFPALVVQEDKSLHGSPCWETVRMVTNDPEQIKRYMAFRNTVQMIRKLNMELSRESRPEPLSKKKEAKDRER